MSIRSKVKHNAKRVVVQNLLKSMSVVLIAICVAIAYAVLVLVANIITELFSVPMQTIPLLENFGYVFSPVIFLITTIIQIALFSPLILGIARWFYRLVGADIPDMSDLFEFYGSAKNYLGSIWYNLNLFFRSLFYEILFLIIPVLVMTFGGILVTGNWMPPNISADAASLIGGLLFMVGMVLMVVAGIFFSIFMKRYLLVPFLYTQGECTVRQAFKTSRKFMKGHKSELFIFDLSYIGWWLLGILIIPLLFIIPYYSAAKALYARYIIEYHQSEQSPSIYSTHEFSAPETAAEDVNEDSDPSQNTENGDMGEGGGVDQ